MKTGDMLYIPGPALGYDEAYEAMCEADALFESYLNWFYLDAENDYDNDRFESIDVLIEGALDGICSDTIKRDRFNRLLFGLFIKRPSNRDIERIVGELQDMICEEVESRLKS